jgi:hypothetical protein
LPKNENDYLSRTLTHWALNDREVAWLWLVLSEREEMRLDACSLNSQIMRDQIAHYLEFNPRLRDDLERARETELLPEGAFDWIEKEGRQPKWLAAEATRETSLRVRNSIFWTLASKAQLVALFDLWDTDFSRKEGVLRRLAEGWNEHLQADKIFKWFKDQDEREKCSLAWSWLEKNKPVLTRREKPFARYAELLEFFDHSDASSGEKELYVEKVKRRWSTQKSRENASEKKQYNFVLTHDVNASLDKLAHEHQLSRTKILELLILGETEHRLYLGPK